MKEMSNPATERNSEFVKKHMKFGSVNSADFSPQNSKPGTEM